MPHQPGAETSEAGRRTRAWRRADEDPELADDEDWIAVQEF